MSLYIDDNMQERKDVDEMLANRIIKDTTEKYVTREEFERTINNINNRIDGLRDAVNELKIVTREQNIRLIDIIKENNERMQSEITKLLTTMLQSKNDIVKETIRSKDVVIKQQSKITLTVLKYELAKGGFAGLIISGFLLLLKMTGVI